LRTYQMFQIENNDCLHIFKVENDRNNNIEFDKLYNIMEKEGFLFVK
jgi:hypothetical protein